MLSNPDIAPSASINRWIISILTFHFTLVHIADTHHGLSHHPLQDDDLVIDNEENFRDWIDQLHRFMHQINTISTPHNPFQHSPSPQISVRGRRPPTMTFPNPIKQSWMTQGYFVFNNG
jgi:hypothetical protein